MSIPFLAKRSMNIKVMNHASYASYIAYDKDTVYALFHTYINATFDVNGGGTASFVTRKYTYGNSYQELPTCTRENDENYSYTFDGWYTAATGGSKIDESTVAWGVSVSQGKNYDQNQTFYAHWSKTSLHTYYFKVAASTGVKPYADGNVATQITDNSNITNGYIIFSCTSPSVTFKWTDSESAYVFMDPNNNRFSAPESASVTATNSSENIDDIVEVSPNGVHLDRQIFFLYSDVASNPWIIIDNPYDDTSRTKYLSSDYSEVENIFQSSTSGSRFDINHRTSNYLNIAAYSCNSRNSKFFLKLADIRGQNVDTGFYPVSLVVSGSWRIYMVNSANVNYVAKHDTDVYFKKVTNRTSETLNVISINVCRCSIMVDSSAVGTIRNVGNGWEYFTRSLWMPLTSSEYKNLFYCSSNNGCYYRYNPSSNSIYILNSRIVQNKTTLKGYRATSLDSGIFSGTASTLTFGGFSGNIDFHYGTDGTVGVSIYSTNKSDFIPYIYQSNDGYYFTPDADSIYIPPLGSDYGIKYKADGDSGLKTKSCGGVTGDSTAHKFCFAYRSKSDGKWYVRYTDNHQTTDMTSDLADEDQTIKIY